MTHILKSSLRLKNAKDFIENFDASAHTVARNHYIFIGKPLPWLDENSPDTPSDTFDQESEAWNNMLSCKKITDGYVTLVVPRINWESGNVYGVYNSNDDDISDTYVLTDEYHIFKCLWNNNGGASTNKPTLPLSSPYEVSSADGYRWKYLATINPTQVDRFLSQGYMPVKTLLVDDGSNQWDVQSAATGNTIDSILITDKGNGYQAVHTGTLAAATSGGGTLPAGVGTLANGWFVGCTIHITGGTGLGQDPKLITAYNGTTKVFAISGTWTADATTTYDICPTVTIVGDGTGAIAKAVVETSAGPDQYKIKRIDMINRGSGYKFTLASISGGQGSGAMIYPCVSPLNGHGSNIESELKARSVMLSARITFNEGSGDFIVDNEYRQLGVIRDLKNYNGTLATSDTLLACKTLLVQGVSGTFSGDETLTAPGGRSAKFVQFVDNGSGEGVIYYLQDLTTGFTAFVDGGLVTGSTSGATATIQTSGVINPEVQKYTGTMLSLDNRRPVVRDENQIETLKFIITF